MKIKQFYTDTFSHKKIIIPFFITIVVLQIAMVILSMLKEQHWIIFADALASLCLIVAISLCNQFNKIKAAKVLATFVFFTQAVFLTAYSFQPFPKAPSTPSGMFAFVVYIVYAISFFALTITALVLHANLNSDRNTQSLSAMYGLYTIQIVLSIILIVGAIVNFVLAGYTHIAMVDFINYFAYGLINFYLLTIETINPIKETKAKKANKK